MKRWMLAVAALVAVGLIAQPVQAQTFGVQAVYGDDADFGVGARVEFPIGGLLTGEGNGLFSVPDDDDNSILSNVIAVVTGNYYFGPDCDPADCSFMDINFNGIIPLEFGEGFAPYAGAGLHWARASADYAGESYSDSEIGLNAVGGAKFAAGNFSAFAEAILNISGAEQLVFAFGVLLGGI